jgi:hypothetical protein
MKEERTIIPFREFAADLSNIFHRVLNEHSVFWVEGERGEFVEVKATPRSQRRHRKPTVDVQAFLAAAGSWDDVDTDAFVFAVREQRDQSYRAIIKPQFDGHCTFLCVEIAT